MLVESSLNEDKKVYLMLSIYVRTSVGTAVYLG